MAGCYEYVKNLRLPWKPGVILAICVTLFSSGGLCCLELKDTCVCHLPKCRLYVLQSECACTVCKYMQTHLRNFNYAIKKLLSTVTATGNSSVCVCVCVYIIYIYIYIVNYNMCVRTVYSIDIYFDHILNPELSKIRPVANLWEQNH